MFGFVKMSTKLLLLYCVVLFAREGFSYNSDVILLGDVKVLTLHKGQYTSARRGSPIPQLQCVGGSAHCSFTPDVVQCTNMGSDGTDYQWECKADLDKKFRFGRMTVSCEGYNHPDDPYVLRGSCGLEYTLESTGSDHRSYQQGDSESYSHKKSSDQGGANSLFVIVCIVGIIGAIVWISNKTRAQPDHPQPPPYGFNSPPPPPGFNNPPPYGFKTENQGFPSSAQQSNAGGFGGFWTGAGVGGLMGYLFGSRGHNAGSTNYPHRRHHGSSSPFFGNTGTHDYGFQSSSSPSSSSSPDTRSASGFAGTKRR